MTSNSSNTAGPPGTPWRPTRRALLATGAAVAGATALGAAPAHAEAGRRTRGNPRDGRGGGAALYSVVEGYSRWTHRTGTPPQSAALDWLERELRDRGAVTGRWSYDYPHYQWTAEVRAGKVRLPTVPLYYEGVGRVHGRAEFVRPVTTSKDGSDPAVLAAVAEAAAAGAAVAVLPTTSTTATYPSYDGLVGYNSDPDVAKTGVPTLLVPGSAADRIQRYGADVDFTARTVRARTYCLTGWFGTRRPTADPIVVTTPLTGWFTCAAERGTGVALALALAAELSREHPVFFLGNTGHELNNYGARAYLADSSTSGRGPSSTWAPRSRRPPPGPTGASRWHPGARRATRVSTRSPGSPPTSRLRGSTRPPNSPVKARCGTRPWGPRSRCCPWRGTSASSTPPTTRPG